MRRDWPLKALGEACEIVNGGTPKTGVSDYWGGPHQWVTPAEMGKLQSPYIDQSERTVTDSGLANSSARPLPSSSVILSSRAPIGHLVINTVPMAFNQGCKGLIPKTGLDYKFLYYFLLSSVPLLESLGTGATFKELSGGKLRQVQIPVPSLNEQKRIVAILDEAFEGIAKVVANAQKNVANAREIFVSHRRAQLATGNFEVMTLGSICDNLDSRRVPITKKDRQSGDIPYYGASGIVDGVREWLFDENLLLVSEDGANLLMRTYPIAFSVSGKCWVNNHAHVLRFSDLSLQKFVEYYLNSISLEKWVSGMAQPKLNQKALNSIPIPTASPRICDRIVAGLDAMAAETDRAAETYREKIRTLSELKQSLLHRAFTGQLTSADTIAA